MFGKTNRSLFDRQPALSEQVVICVPTNGLVHALFTFCLINAIRYTEARGIPVVLDMDAGTVLSNQRQVLLNTALFKHDADHIMWFDSDMTFPEDTIIRLLEHKKKIVCATYSKRVPPFHPTAFYNINPVEPVDTTKHGLEIVRYAGFGCLLMKTSALDNIEAPHFPLRWHEMSNTWHGEDMGFCDLMNDHGIKVYCDLDLSREIGHLGQQEFRVNQAN
jgi:hypothetical protein